MNKIILKTIQVAIDVAQIEKTNKKTKSNHAAVLLKNNKITGFGCNSQRTNWVQRIYAKRAGSPKKVVEHAEFAAMRDANGVGDTIVVIRLGVGGQLLNSKPCSVCSLMLKESNIKHVYFSNVENGISYERIN